MDVEHLTISLFVLWALVAFSATFAFRADGWVVRPRA